MQSDTKQVPSTGKKRPPAAGKGRKPGSVNKNTKELKDMILKALHDSGGVDYLVGCAKNPRTAAAFLGLIGKVLPMQITGQNGGPIVARIELVAPSVESTA